MSVFYLRLCVYIYICIYMDTPVKFAEEAFLLSRRRGEPIQRILRRQPGIPMFFTGVSYKFDLQVMHQALHPLTLCTRFLFEGIYLSYKQPPKKGPKCLPFHPCIRVVCLIPSKMTNFCIIWNDDSNRLSQNKCSFQGALSSVNGGHTSILIIGGVRFEIPLIA